MWRKLGSLALISFVFVGLYQTVEAEPGSISIVVSIRPLHSLVAQIANGVAEPILLLDQSLSPHSASLRPSQMAQLSDADLIFWFGPELERFMETAIASSGPPNRDFALLESPGLQTLKVRDDADFGGLAGWDGAGHEHDHVVLDPHVWLDPVNAAVLLSAIHGVLVDMFPHHRELLGHNLARSRTELTTIEASIRSLFDPQTPVRFVGFHDAFQYFEARFDLRSQGVIALNPEVGIGAKRMRHLTEMFSSLQIDCAFHEPYYPKDLVESLSSASDVKLLAIDPIGSTLTPGPELYPNLLTQIASSFANCRSN